MDWPQFAAWGFQSLIAGVIIYGVNRATGALTDISERMASISDSVDDLNKQMAVIIERDQWHTKWLERHDDEIKNIKYVKMNTGPKRGLEDH